MASANGNTFDLSQWSDQTGNDMYGMINREVNRHNYGLAMSDARLA